MVSQVPSAVALTRFQVDADRTATVAGGQDGGLVAGPPQYGQMFDRFVELGRDRGASGRGPPTALCQSPGRRPAHRPAGPQGQGTAARAVIRAPVERLKRNFPSPAANHVQEAVATAANDLGLAVAVDIDQRRIARMDGALGKGPFAADTFFKS